MHHGHTRLLHRSRGQSGKTDDVACRINIGHAGLIFFIDENQAALSQFDAEVFQAQPGDVALPSGGE
jgi:hypothetical protein